METILEVRGLRKVYGKAKSAQRTVAVDGVDFTVQAGTCFGLLGPNGAGKSTTIEIIEGVKDATAGEILYKGATLRKKFQEEVGIQFQNTELPMYLTVKETLETFRRLYDHRAPLEEIIHVCRLEDILHKENNKISGGQKQRLLLAIALANDPELVFLDEPTTGLDPQARRHLWEIVRDIKARGKTLVLTTHYMEEAELLCDRIAIMDHGKILAMDTPQRLLEKHCPGVSVLLPGVEEETVQGLGFEVKKSLEGVEIIAAEVNGPIRALMEKGIDLTAMTVRRRNLEDLFLQLTGHDLRS